MDDDNFSEGLFFLQMKRDRRKKLGNKELVHHFEEGEKNLDSAVEDYNNQLIHLLQNLKQAFNDRETNPTILGRRYVGLRQRISALDKAAFSIRSAYADIWQALEWALEDSPLRALSERGRAGFIGKVAKNPIAKAQAVAREAIKKEWDRWQAGRAKYDNDEDFGRKMHRKFAGVYKNERSITNCSRKWREKG